MEEEIRELSASIVKQAKKKNITICSCESCTGGLIAAALTSIPGSSDIFNGSIVSYTNPVKHNVLGVDQSILDDPKITAVSAECAKQMALGGKKLLKTTYAISVTGIAGPTGALPEKPVGTVFIGEASENKVDAFRFLFDGNRTSVRKLTLLESLKRINTFINNF